MMFLLTLRAIELFKKTEQLEFYSRSEKWQKLLTNGEAAQR